MSLLDAFWHLLNFIAPAVWVAWGLAACARWVWRRSQSMLPWWQIAALNTLLGCMVLGLGLVLTGQDGRMGTYAALVVALATVQCAVLVGCRR